MSLAACSVARRSDLNNEARLRATSSLVAEVKAFGKTLGIEPTTALTRTSAGDQALSMLWFWFQRAGTLAISLPMDIRMAVGFAAAKERLPVEQVYRVDGYSVYYRQGNEYADPRSAATPGFAAQGTVRRVTVILHEDLHGDTNFDLPWDLEESVVTPLGSLAAVAYFKHKHDAENIERAQAALAEGKQISRDLHQLVAEAQLIFRNAPVEEAKERILRSLSKYPEYQSMFERQVTGQHPPTVLEAKLSHDLAYFRFFEAIVSLGETPLALQDLIAELKALPRDATPEHTEKFLRALHTRYSATQH